MNSQNNIWKQLQQKVNQDLYPGFFIVLKKLIPIHFVASAITLFLCPQFGLPLATQWIQSHFSSASAVNSAKLPPTHNHLYSLLDPSQKKLPTLNNPSAINSILTKSPIEDSFAVSGLKYYFMKLGPQVCEFLCGSFFFLLTFLFARLLLNPFQRRTLAKHAFAYTHLLIISSIFVFILINPDYALQNIVFWWMGAFIIFYSLPKLEEEIGAHVKYLSYSSRRN